MQAVETTPLRAFRIDRGVSTAAVAAAAGLSVDEVAALERGDIAAFASRHDMDAAALRYGTALGLSGPVVLDLLGRTLHTVDPAREPAAPAPRAHTSPDSPVAPSYASVRIAGDGHQKRFVRSDSPPDAEPEADALVAAPAAPARQHAPVPALAPGHGQTGVALLRSITAPDAAPPADPEPVDTDGALAADPWTTGEIEVVQAARAADPVFRERFDMATSELEAWAAGGAAVDADATWLGTAIRRNGARWPGGPEGAHRTASRVDAAGAAVRARAREVRTWMEESSYGSLIVASVVGMVIIAGLITIGGSGSDERTPAVATAPAKPAAKPGKTAASSTMATPELRPVKARKQLTIDVLNSGSVTGKADRIAGKLEQRGYRVREVGNSSKIYPTPVVLYAPNHQREAERMAKDAGISTVDKLEMLQGGPVKLIVIIK